METTLKEQLSQHMTATGISQEAAAKEMGISNTTLSQWRNGKYPGRNDVIAKTITGYLKRQGDIQVETTVVKKDFDFVETSVYKDILSGVDLADYRGEIRVISGDSGVGKTMALRHIAQERSNVIFIEVYRGIRPRRFLVKLCEEVDLPSHGCFGTLLERLFNGLKGSDRLIMVDEAEHLPLDALDALRRINDLTGCGVVMAGLPIFYERLKACQGDYAYIFNRTAIRIQVGHITLDDASKMVSTMFKGSIEPSVWFEASGGIGRDLRIITQESIRVSKENPDKDITRIIKGTTLKLGRVIDKS